MSLLSDLESKLAGLVEGTFGRVFKTEVRPVELARGLAKEMDAHRTQSLSRTYVPNEFVVWLSRQDRGRYDGMEQEVADELSAYVLEHARQEGLSLVATPRISFETDPALDLGEFGIQARLVREPARASRPAERAPEPAEFGRTMVHSTAERLQEPLQRERRGREGLRPRTAYLLAEGKRMPVGPRGVVLGRSRDCDLVLADANISRHHAEVRPAGEGWTVDDLGSTNGVRVNGRPVDGPTPVGPGDRIELGTVRVSLEVE